LNKLLRNFFKPECTLWICPHRRGGRIRICENKTCWWICENQFNLRTNVLFDADAGIEDLLQFIAKVPFVDSPDVAFF